MKKLLKKLGKRPDREEDAAAKEASAEAPLRTEQFGLFLLHDDRPGADNARQYPVNVIAVHGLNGDAYSTWTDPSNGTLWLKHLLPKFMPGCRVYTYGYPSQVVFNRSFAEVSEYARRLLDSVRGVWEDWPEGTRSIIFVCHSLGGIVCKQALVHAHEDDITYGDVLKSIPGIIFLGTPHRGSNVATLGNIIGTMIDAFTTTASAGVLQNRVIRRDLLDHLSSGSKALQELSLSVRNRLLGLKIVSFHETNPLPPLNILIVEKASAALEIPGEEVITLFEDHRSMCRFSGETESYKSVSRAIRRIANEVQTRERSGSRAVIRSPERSLDEYEKSCMAVFSAFDVSDYQKSLARPATGTCQWILRHPMFLSWVEKANAALLWLTGHPGCGKTILSLFLAGHFEETQSPFSPKGVYIYFCDDKIAKQKDANGILLGLIFQIICRHRSLIRHVKRAFEVQGTNIVRSFTALWNVCTSIVLDPKCGATCIIIDALDECEKDTRRKLLDAIYGFVRSASSLTSCVKFILTSRPSLSGIETSVGQVASHRIFIDEDQAGYLGDLQIFIQQRVDQIAKERNFSSETKTFLKENLSSKAGETFLWVHMVLASLENSLLVSKKALQDLIASIPPDLEATYLSFLASIPPDHQATASKLLHLILGTCRPLSLQELNIAYTVDATHRTCGDVVDNWQESMQHTVQGILGPLVRLSDSKVSLVHQSVKDFVLQERHVYNIPPAVRQVTPASAALSISSSCIFYLLLEDFSNDLFAPDDKSTTNSVLSSSPSPGAYSGSPTGSIGAPFWDTAEKELEFTTLFKEPEMLETDRCRLIAERYAFYRYASLNWTKHYSACEASAPEELRRAVRSLVDVSTTHGANWWRFFAVESEFGHEDIPYSPSRLTLAAFFNLKEAVNAELRDYPPSSEALFWAAHAGHNHIVQRLLEVGADPNAPGPDGYTPLTIAAQNGHLDCVTALLHNPRTQVNLCGRKGRTALHLACSHQHPSIVYTLLHTPTCDANIPDDSGATPLTWAARVSDNDILTVAALLKHPTTNPNHPDRKGRTALSWAAGDGIDLAVKALLDHPSTDPNLADTTLRTPLSWAAGNGRAPSARLLLRPRKRGVAVDKSTADRDNRNAYSWAAAGGHVDTLQVLLRYRCPGEDEPDTDAWAPLAWAVQCKSARAAEVLLGTGKVDLERKDRGGRTALSWAVEYGQVGVVKALLEAGADPLVRDAGGVTIAEGVRGRPGREAISDELWYFAERKKSQG